MPDDPQVDQAPADQAPADQPPLDQAPADDERVARRSELLAEEKAAASDDPEAQARAILADSETRIASRHAAPGTHREHRTSDEATPPA